MSKFRQLLLALFVFCSSTAGAYAQATNLTQIRDTINNPDGTPFNGTVVITWVGFSTPTSGSVSPLSTSASIYNGALSVLLVPSTTAATGSHYQVIYYSNDGTVTWTETWSVPVSTNPLSVSGVRTSSTSGGGTSTGTGTGGTTNTGGTYATLPIAISQVTGLGDDLNSINTAITALQTTVAGLGTGSGSSDTTLAATVATLSTTVSGLTTTVGGLSTTVTGLSATSASTTSTVTGLSTSFGVLSGTVTTNGNALTTLTGVVNALNTTVGTLSTTVNGLSTSMTTNTGSLTTLTNSVGNISNTVTGLQATVAALQSSGSNATIAVAFIDGETPSGATNSVNAIFNLSQAPTPAGSLELYRNGLVQTSGVDYTVSGSRITFATGNIPVTGDLLQAYYRVTGSSPTPTFVDDEVPSGTVNGTNLTFVLAYAPSPQVGLRLYKNGMLMQQHADYTLSGSTITFVTVSTPQVSDAIVAYYRH